MTIALRADLKLEVFRAARAYHAALAAYARAFVGREDVDMAAQAVVGASLRYQVALDGYIEHGGPDLTVMERRMLHLHRLLHAASRQYDALRKAHKRPFAGLGAEW
jgi:hypothetical protein